MTIGTTKHLYGYPDMGRTGLAHSLLAWARCAIWCRETGATMLAPLWLRPRIGPYLRRERDKRNYALLFHKGPYVGEPKRAALLLTANRFYAELDLPAPGYQPSKPTVVIFRNAMANNEKKLFHLVAAHAPYLREQLVGMTRPRYVPTKASAPFIAAHIRLGDFHIATAEQLRSGSTNSRIPPEWYAAVAQQLRAQLGANIPLVVFSDGSDAALAPILSLPSVTRSPRQPSVTDLLSISNASVLIASGSGFSHWGAFLGTVPRICYPGQALSRSVKLVEAEIETDGVSPIPDDFVRLLFNDDRRAADPLHPSC
jgi:hypothetical protein